MAAHLQTRELEDGSAADGIWPAAEIRAALARILESRPFRTSKQCKDLLGYIVERSLARDDARLRERVIGVEVFGRDPAYNTDEDPVVRVRAADVRKRLAQYYQSVEPGSCLLRIEVQPGSYRARFSGDRFPAAISADPPLGADHFPHPAPQATREKQPALPFRRRRLLALMLLLALPVGALLWIAQSATFKARQRWTSPQERFLQPLLAARRPVLVYLGSNAAYVFSSSFLAKYRATHDMPNTGPEFFVGLPPGSSVRAEDLVPVKDTFVTASDAAAAVQITKLLSDWKKAFLVRSGSDLSISDLRDSPAVLIGAFNNPWTIEITSGLPFRFREGVRIEDRDRPSRSWSVSLGSGKDLANSTTDDYALITRVLVSKTGGPAVTVAGISEYGTRAAAEFLADPEKMRELLKTAPIGWEGKNMQAVLHIKVLGSQPVAEDVAASVYW